MSVTPNLPEPDIQPGDPVDHAGTPSDIYEWGCGVGATVQLYPTSLFPEHFTYNAEIGINSEEPMSVDDAETLALALLAAVQTARA